MFKLDINFNNFIGLFEDFKKIIKKIKCVVIDLDEYVNIYFDLKEKVGVLNLLILFFLLMGKFIDSLVLEYEDKMYGYLKGDVVEVVVFFIILI